MSPGVLGSPIFGSASLEFKYSARKNVLSPKTTQIPRRSGPWMIFIAGNHKLPAGPEKRNLPGNIFTYKGYFCIPLYDVAAGAEAFCGERNTARRTGNVNARRCIHLINDHS